MSFQDLLNKEINKTEQGNSNDGGKKAEFLQLGKGKPDGYKVLVRVLPTVQPDGHFGALYRKAIINYFGLRPGQDTPSNQYTDIVAPIDDTSYAEQKLLQWINEGKQVSQFPIKGLKTNFMMNVIKVIENPDGTLSYNLDDNGNLQVQPFEVTYTAYQSLMKAINEPRNRPQGCNSDYSFVSGECGAPIEFEKPKQGSGVMQWTVTPFIQMSQSLPPLPQGWENQLNDLSRFTQPTTDEYVKTYLEPAFEEQGMANPQAIDSQIPTNMGGQQPQQPIQQVPQQSQGTYQAPQQPNNQPQQQTGQGNFNQGNGNFNWDALAQQQQQPEQQGNPFANWNPSAVDDSQVPFNTQEQNTNQNQPQHNQQANMNVPPQQPAQQQQQQQKAPQPNTNEEPPAQPQGDNLPPDIQNLINQSQNQ